MPKTARKRYLPPADQRRANRVGIRERAERRARIERAEVIAEINVYLMTSSAVTL